MNVIFISYPHSYYELLKKVDVMIRATSTDGDSISVKEALYLGKKVICSNVVSRPKETILYNYNDKEDLVTIINNIHKRTNPMLNPNSMDGSISLIQLYKYLLQ
jgi:glycosyltransferase involved in cell wall biosynthesis